MPTSPNQSTFNASSFNSFLGLSSELRNRIYECVFLAEHGLHASYIETSGQHAKTSMTLVLHRDEDHQRWELRRGHPFGLDFTAAFKPPMGINQLKYVCRQLYFETNNMELKVNQELIVLHDQHHFIDPIVQLAMMFKKLSAQHIAWLSSIILLATLRTSYSGFGDENIKAKQVAEVVQVAHAYSHITFKIFDWLLCKKTVEQWEYGVFEDDFEGDFLYAEYIQLALRGTKVDIARDTNLQLGSSVQRAGESALRWRGDVALEDLQAPNLRIYPDLFGVNVSALDERMAGASGKVLSTGQLFRTRWFQLVEDWSKNGL